MRRADKPDWLDTDSFLHPRLTNRFKSGYAIKANRDRRDYIE